MPFSELLSYVLLVVGFALTPGPNMMLYLTYTFEYGRKAGWATAAGIMSSFLVHITAIIFGLTALLVAMPHALDIFALLWNRLPALSRYKQPQNCKMEVGRHCC